MTLDVPDSSGNYNSPSHQLQNALAELPPASSSSPTTLESKRARPGHAVAMRKVHLGSRETDLETVGEVTDEEKETRVEIQITEDGTIRVISDKETT
ncbi:unnamed protein product, partial [Nesidiocoris tenuis]